MKQWNKINWSAINRFFRKIEVDLQQWSLAQNFLKGKGTTATGTQTDHIAAEALMVWADDGGPEA